MNLLAVISPNIFTIIVKEGKGKLKENENYEAKTSHYVFDR